jgi:NAD(P)-dependent dehydrogenase (short-subunit alcohol dehydrogenase family)
VSHIDFDGRVAIVTGAGRGLGAAYAELLASRGAAVLVNDLGTDLAGSGVDKIPATDVVKRITNHGGIATANHDDVSRKAGAAAMVSHAIRQFGKVDILINNAGIFLPEHALAECVEEDFERVWRVHVMGSIHSTMAVWPHMKARGYGRVLNIGSTGGYFGAPGRYEYCTAKGGIHGFTMTLADEGRQCGISVNILCPGGYTRPIAAKVASAQVEGAGLTVELAAPLAVWLTHADCVASGQVFESMCGQSSSIVTGFTRGHFSRNPTLELIAENFADICATGIKEGELYFPAIAPERAAMLMTAYSSNT